ncbi:MAG TPA: 6-phosphogluconolactonase [Thermoanaerobaculia bacterium]|jgi:6-phosphogluconolactonase|nr:6-phosphogluconolactonase [Thermoanaerobaculia bacterium]
MAELSPGAIEVRVFETVPELMRAAAEVVVRGAEEAVRERGFFSWALSGGSTPRDLYSLLASPPYRDRLPWNAVHVFWGDERHVPPDDPDSNFRMAREAMLDSVPLPAANIHRIHAEEPDAEVAAKAYETGLQEFFHLAPAPQDIWPRFDLILLGLGKDAHTASLFPGGEAVHESARLVVAPWVAAQNTFRITLTPPVLNHARLVAFIAAGDDKAEPLRAVLEGARDPERYPAQIVEGNRLWLVDRAAARLLATAA